MSGYSQPNLGPQNSGLINMLKNPMVLGAIVVVILSVALWYFGFFSSEESERKSKRLFYNPLSTPNVLDAKNLVGIRANEYSALSSENAPITGSGPLWVGRRPRRPSYPRTASIPENPITESSIIVPPLPNPTPETSTQVMIPELPGLTARYTSQNFGNTQDLTNPALGGRIGADPIPPYGSFRRSKRTVPY